MSANGYKSGATTPNQAASMRPLFAGTLVSRLLGFVRDMLFAALLGPAADAFVTAFRLPNIFRRLLAEGSLGLPLAAESARLAADARNCAHTKTDAFLRAKDFSTRVSLGALTVSAFLCLLAAVFARPFLYILAPGLEASVAQQAVLCLRLCLPYVPLCLFSALAFAQALAAGNALAQAYAPSAVNVCLILAACLAFLVSPAAPKTASLLLCAGLLAGSLVQALIAARCLDLRVNTLFSLWRDALRGLARPTPERRFLQRLPEAMAGAAPHQLHILAALFLASFAAPGCISALYFAERLVELPLGLAGAAPALAMLPGLSRSAAQKDWPGFSQSISATLSMGQFIALPAAAGLFALAAPITGLLFGHGAFDADMVALCAAALSGYALGLPALSAARSLITALHTLKADKGALRDALFSLGPLALAGAAAPCMPSNLWQGAALGAGMGASAWLLAWLLLRRMRRNAPWLPNPFAAARSFFLRYALSALFLGAVLCCLSVSGLWACAAIALSLFAWFGGHLAWGSPDAAAFVAMLRKKRPPTP